MNCLQKRARNATSTSVDEGSEEGQGLQPKFRSSFAARCCHKEGGDGPELLGSTGQVAERTPALQWQSWQHKDPRETPSYRRKTQRRSCGECLLPQTGVVGVRKVPSPAPSSEASY